MSQSNVNTWHFTVAGTLILQDITLDGMHSETVNSGGGVYVNNGSLTMNDGAVIQNCSSNNTNGGGIYTNNTSYGNLSINSKTVFGCNRASAAYNPPEDAGTLYPNIQFVRTTITDHPLNNFDINYTEVEPIAVAYNVIYDANGGSGSYMSPDTLPGGTHTVLSSDETGTSREGYTFSSWNTEQDDSGTEYTPGAV